MPSETNFPVPCDGQVAKHLQLIVTGLVAMSAQNQHEAKFVLKKAADWPDLEEDLRFEIWQRDYTFALVARYNWATAIHFAAASGGGPPHPAPAPARGRRRR